MLPLKINMGSDGALPITPATPRILQTGSTFISTKRSVLILVPLGQESTINNANGKFRTICTTEKRELPEVKSVFSLEKAKKALTEDAPYSLVIVSLSPAAADTGKNKAILDFLNTEAPQHAGTQFIVFGNETTIRGKTNTSNVTFAMNDRFGKTIESVWEKLST